MLEFYMIKDSEAIPNFKEALTMQYIGNLDLPTYFNLQKKNIIDSRYSFFSDFRWELKDLLKIVNIVVSEKKGSDTDVKQLLTIVLKAIDENSGLIAICD